MTKFIAIIPARYASTRFPGKPLAILGGKPVIQRVYEQVTSVLPHAYVATDDQRIFDTVVKFGGNAIMTRSDHKSGTDRIQEALTKINIDADVVVNIQGDEPFIQQSQIETLCKSFTTIEAVESPNSPKIVVSNSGYAMYFSRSIIPFVRGAEKQEWINSYPFLKHLGIYAYRKEVLSQITKLPQSSLEIAESLEQLRWLQNGYKIKVGTTSIETVGIDTPEDLERAEAFLAQHEKDNR